MNNEQIAAILVGAHTTEKSVSQADKFRRFAFKVADTATKPQIKRAVESLFKVTVNRVRVSRVKGKSVRFKQRQGRRSGWKKAIVSLQEGHDINLAEFE